MSDLAHPVPSEEIAVPPQVQEIAQNVLSGTKESRTVRELLSYFGYKRRGYFVRQQVSETLRRLGIETNPDFEFEWIDAPVEFRPLATAVVIADTLTMKDSVDFDLSPAPAPDPTRRIGLLDAANKPIDSVAPDDQLATAITKMLASDYSQLPVMQGERDVKGVITWSCIGTHLAFGKRVERVRDCMEPHVEVKHDSSLFQAIPHIVQHGYVLVRTNDKKISGIVTSSDLSLEFRQLAEPFLLLGEIELHIRRIIDEAFDSSQIQSLINSDETQRDAKTAAKLTLGDCQRLLDNPSRWERLGLRIDRSVFILTLDQVRNIRNDVMHFNLDRLPDEDLSVLRSFSTFLQKLRLLAN